MLMPTLLVLQHHQSRCNSAQSGNLMFTNSVPYELNIIQMMIIIVVVVMT